jgi:calcium-translocating P-type ATPase
MKYKFEGLDDAAVLQSRKIHGANDLPPVQVGSFFGKLLENFDDPLIKILCAALVTTLVLAYFGYAEWYEGVGIGSAVFLATFVSTYSEFKNETYFQQLQQKASMVKNNVFRNGSVVSILTTQIVVEDYVVLQLGDKVPADGVLVDGELSVRHDMFDGEVRERLKLEAPPSYIPANPTDLRDKFLVFRGTLVCNGEGVLKVKAVGENTFYGKIHMSLNQTEERDSPLQVKLSALADGISLLGYCGAVFIAISFLFKQFVMDNHYDLDEIVHYISHWHTALHDVVTAVILAIIVVVVAVPEGLPMMIAIVLSLNMRKLLRSNVLVRKLLGIETAGSVDLLFVDKTGTLTKGVFLPKLFISGDVAHHQGYKEMPKELLDTLAFAIRESSSSIIAPSGQIAGGNETDKALLAFLDQKHLLVKLDIKVARKIPFNSERKFSVSSVCLPPGAEYPYSLQAFASSKGIELSIWKGTPEKILSRCTYYITRDGSRISLGSFDQRLAADVDRVSTAGSRMIAIALSEVVDIDEKVPDGMTLVGVIGVLDELRPEARPSILRAQQAGVQVVMVTGDKEETAVSVARNLGLLESDTHLVDRMAVISSHELQAMTDEQVKDRMPGLRVIARAVPTDKLRLVTLAQQCQKVVGMTGDGANDALALKQADVGFALGKSGSEVAKEAADIVVLDDNFHSITQAILYGRTIYKSIQKFIVFQSTINIASSSIVFLGPFLGIDFPLTLIQLLWVNMVMDTLAALAFGGEPALARYMKETPIQRDKGIITTRMWFSIFTGGFFIAALSIFALTSDYVETLFVRDGHISESAFLTAFFAFFVFLSVINALNVRTNNFNPFDNLTGNTGFIVVLVFIFVVQIAFTKIGGQVLRTVELYAHEWALVILSSLIILPYGFCTKLVFNIVFPSAKSKQE